MKNENVIKSLNVVFNSFEELMDKELNNNSSQVEESVDSVALKTENQVEKSKINNDRFNKSAELINKAMDIRKMQIESKQIDLEVQRLRNNLVEIISTHKSEMKIIEHIFSERKMFFDKMFEVIDKGLVDGNSDFVHLGMSMANVLIHKNPLAIISDYSERKTLSFDNNNPLELDF